MFLLQLEKANVIIFNVIILKSYRLTVMKSAF